VIGGLWGGIFTPNEAGAIGAAGALVIGLARHKMTRQKFKSSVEGAMRTTIMILTVVIGAMIFNRFLAVSTLPIWLASYAEGLLLPPMVVLVVILLIYAALGCVFDSGAIVLLTVPIFFPVILALDFDPIWFGVTMAVIAELGLITPPIGMNVYVISGIAKNIPINAIFKGVAPFIIPMIVCVILIIIFPQITLGLVNLF
jgi:tripartite ATP-independent transporter DctM subunit